MLIATQKAPSSETDVLSESTSEGGMFRDPGLEETYLGS